MVCRDQGTLVQVTDIMSDRDQQNPVVAQRFNRKDLRIWELPSFQKYLEFFSVKIHASVIGTDPQETPFILLQFITISSQEAVQLGIFSHTRDLRLHGKSTTQETPD